MFGAVMTAAPVHSATQCDRLGALQADPMAVSAPVSFDAIDANALISACTLALQTDGTDRARYLLQRARGYLRAGRGDQAMQDIRAAHDLDYPAAAFALATAYFWGTMFRKILNRRACCSKTHTNRASTGRQRD